MFLSFVIDAVRKFMIRKNLEIYLNYFSLNFDCFLQSKGNLFMKLRITVSVLVLLLEFTAQASGRVKTFERLIRQHELYGVNIISLGIDRFNATSLNETGQGVDIDFQGPLEAGALEMAFGTLVKQHNEALAFDQDEVTSSLPDDQLKKLGNFLKTRPNRDDTREHNEVHINYDDDTQKFYIEVQSWNSDEDFDTIMKFEGSNISEVLKNAFPL